MHGDVLIIVLVLFFGCAAFLFGIIYAVCRGLAWIGCSVARLFRIGPVWTCSRGPRLGPTRVCPQERCRHVESRAGARYCARCGAPLL